MSLLNIIIKGLRKVAAHYSSDVPDYVGSYSLLANSLSDGVFTGNSFISPDWELRDGSKSGAAYSFGRRAANDTYDDNLFIQSKHASRDMEVTFSDTTALLLLRAGTEGAVMFHITSGIIEISRASMAAGQAQFFLNHYNQIYVQSDSAIITAMTNTVGDSSGTWTIGCKGIDLYIKRNGVEVVHIQDFDVVNPGYFVVQNSNQQYGNTVYGPILVTHFERVSMYSDTDNNIIDLRDFTEFRVNATTTGSMDISDPYKLNVASIVALKVKVGDYVSVATGGEAAQNGRVGTTRGMICVGGGYPVLWTDNETTLQAATDWPYETPIALRSTGEIWRNYGAPGQAGQCYRTLYSHTYAQQTSNEENYPIGYARGWDLYAKVTTIDANTNVLTLDRPCEVSTTNADVWVDMYPFFAPIVNGYNYLTVGHGKIFKLPAGDIYCSGGMYWNLRPDFGLIGAGVDVTRFISPNGTAPYDIDINTGCNNFIMKDFTIKSNYVESPTEYNRDQWGIPHHGPQNNNTYIAYGNSSGIFSSGVAMGNMTNGLIQNIKFQNFYNGCMHMQQAHNSLSTNCSIEMWGDPKMYAAWIAGMDDGCTNSKITYLNFTSRFRLPALEFFGGSGNEISNCTVHNGMISSNSGENALILNNTFTFDANVLPAWQVFNNPLCNINGNNGRGQNSPAQVIGNSFYIHGADAYNNQTQCINVQAGRDGCLVKGNYIEYLDIPTSDAIGKFAIGIGTDSKDITIEDNTVIVPEAAWFVEGNPGNGCEIYINDSVTTGAKIRRNTCHIIGAPVNNPTECIIDTTGPDANNVDIIYYSYEAVWRRP